MLLRDLLATPALGLRLLHGGDAELDRPVRWVYTTDLIDPARYLSGGELVVSGLVWRQAPADSERFVAALAGSGAAALAAGAAVFHGIPDDLVEACRRHGLVLIEVPEEVSFAAVTEAVIGSVTAARGDRLAQTLGRQRQLLSAVAAGLGLDELADRVSAAIGCRCRVLTPTGRHVVAGPRPLAPDDLARVVRAFLTAGRLPATVAGAGRRAYSVFPVGPASEQRLTSWFVVVEGAWAEWESEITEAVGELVAIAALDRARRSEGLRVARDIADDAVGLIATGAGALPETGVRLRQAGLDAGAPLLVAVAGFADRPDLVETARSVLVDAAAHAGPPVVGTARDGLAVALLPGADPAAGAALTTALERLEPGVGRTRLTVGVSRPAAAAALSGALQEARHARDLAQLGTAALRVVTGAEVTSHVALLATVPDDVRKTFAARVLDPVLAYDARTGAGLRETLEAFLDCSGSWSRAAEVLHLHVNTVRYRIGRVEELTGRDLGRFSDRVDVFLALRSPFAPGCSGEPGGPGGRGAVVGHGGLDQPVRPVRGVEHLVRVLQPERGEVDDEVVPVGRRQSDLGDLRVRLQHRAAHLPQRLLQRERVHRREPLQQDPAHVGPGLVPVHVPAATGGADVPPPGEQRRRQHPVVRLGQRGVLVGEEAGELRAGRLQQHEVAQPGHHPRVGPVDGDDGRADLRPAPHPGVVVPAPVHLDPVPAELLDLDPGTLDGPDVVDEVPAQREGVVLDFAQALLLGERVAGVLLGVGGKHARLVTVAVGGGEVAAQRRGDHDVADLVAVGVAVDPHDAVLRLPVLVVPEHDGHVCQLPR
jgi:DNA-binding PucR family transcriptional regulator